MREPKEPEVFLAERLQESSHSSGLGYRGDSSTDLSPVLLRVARGLMVGRGGRRRWERQTSAPGSVGENSLLEAGHHSALPLEALEARELHAPGTDRSSRGGIPGSPRSLLPRAPAPGNPLGATCWAQRLG